MTNDSLLKTPLVSVVMPTYNRAHTLLRAISSVLTQTFTNHELIVVDDASIDNTINVVRSIDDPRFRYVSHSVNKGGAAARNTGISLARGKYIAFQDSDDEWLAQKLDWQIRILEHADDVGAVYTGYYLIKDNLKAYYPANDHWIQQGNVHSALLRSNFISTQTLLIRSSILSRAGGFDEKLRRLQDWDLVLRLSKICNMHFIHEPLVNVYYSQDSISANDQVYIPSLEYILNKYQGDYSKYPKVAAEHYYNIGVSLLSLGRRSDARSKIICALKRNIRTKYIAVLLLSIIGFNAYQKFRVLYKMLS